MKTLLIFTLLTFTLTTSCCLSPSAQTPLTFPISSIEVHQEGARITHSGFISLRTLSTAIEISNLSHDLEFNSISLDLPIGCSVESMNFEVRNRPSSHLTELNQVIDQISRLDVKTRMLEAVLHTYKEEQLFLSANRSIGSSQEVLLVDDVIEMADFLRERHQALSLDILDVTLDIEELQSESQELSLSKTALELAGSDLEGVLTLDLKVLDLITSNFHSDSQPQPLTLKYLTPSAHWSPEYEVNLSSSGILIKRFASISQTSGLPWSSVPLVLISGRPSNSLSPIPFSPWFITASHTTKEFSLRGARADSQDDEIDSQSSFSSYVGKTRNRFELEVLSIIPSDGNPTRVEIDEFPLKGNLRYLATPSTSPKAYTTIRIADWSGHSLMDGKAHVIADNSYLGSFPLELPVIGDTLIMYLGSNPHVLCSRTLSEELSKSSFLSRKSITSTWILAVENSLTDSISVDLIDALPQSSKHGDDIEITITASDSGEIDLINHLVTYSLDLAPGERREVSLTITVTHPRRMTLRGL